MHIKPIFTISFIVITILMTTLIRKRLGNKSGCISFGYIGLILFSINIFFIFSWVFLATAVKETFLATTSGDNYTATVVSFTTKKTYNSDEERYETMHNPTIRFITKEGRILQRELDFSSSGIEVGDTYQINFNEQNNTVITKGFLMYIKLAASFILCFIFTFLFIGEILYVFKFKMESYYDLIKKVGFHFFIPFLMIGFNILLVYALFYGNEVPLGVSIVLVFFIIVMTLAIVGYLKMIKTKGTPKMKRVAPNRWTGDWEE